MKTGSLLGAVALISACSFSVIPEGAARGASDQVSDQHSGQQLGEWTQGISDLDQPQSTINVNPAKAIKPVASDQLVKIGGNETRAVGVGIALGPDIGALGIDAARASGALKSFRTSCSSLARREDNSGLTQGQDWQQSCDAAKAWPENDANRFFESYFEAVQIGDGKAFATGYFEPEIKGSRVRNGRYQVPVYRRPTNLLDVDLGLFSEELKDKKIRGKIDGTKLVPFEDRGQIDDGALAGQGLEIAWVEDYIDFFVLQIQGSGRLALPDGSVMRIGYASQNGRDYTGIGKLMRERGLLADGKTNMQGIVEWLRANPQEGMKIMRENKSYVFFNELTGPGPLGAMGHPVVGRVSVAADRQFVPLGAPVFLNMEHDIADGLWVAQDTGGAIKGSNRFDTFWGAGEEAARIAGGMSSRGQALIFLPKGTFARLTGR
ncbi:murein transglycosylase A [Parasphingorhabdus halotolerans]|uniref:peptidoglycan lytic exotransglycosylase n=2 Tax=Parasphingorhabdus halotolerans TaxID=2725558 RepID=A0A6H2DMC0_9SPHN|nr:murein transglycosylase A [Parasphingorhabdus halotolerans]